MSRPSAAWGKQLTLSVWIYDSPQGAAAGLDRLNRLIARGAVAAVDAVTLTWVAGGHRPRIGHPNVGMVIGSGNSPLLALVRRLLFPDATASHLPALAEALQGTGIDEDFLRRTLDSIVPESSALLVLSQEAELQEVQVVVERGAARGDVRLLYAVLAPESLPALTELAIR